MYTMLRKPRRSRRSRILLGLVLVAALLTQSLPRSEAFAPTNGLAPEIFGITDLTKSMKKAIEQIAEANAAVDEDQFLSSKHFDGENFPGGQSFVLANRRLVVSTIPTSRPASQAARERRCAAAACSTRRR